jgi:hypothetical protein
VKEKMERKAKANAKANANAKVEDEKQRKKMMAQLAVQKGNLDAFEKMQDDDNKKKKDIKCLNEKQQQELSLAEQRKKEIMRLDKEKAKYEKANQGRSMDTKRIAPFGAKKEYYDGPLTPENKDLLTKKGLSDSDIKRFETNQQFHNFWLYIQNGVPIELAKNWAIQSGWPRAQKACQFVKLFPECSPEKCYKVSATLVHDALSNQYQEALEVKNKHPAITLDNCVHFVKLRYRQDVEDVEKMVKKWD